MRIALISIFLFCMYTTYAQRKHLLFEDTFENATDLSKWYHQEKSFPNSITITDSVARSGHFAMRVIIRKGDPVINNGIRAEVVLKPESKINIERWIGFSVLLPETFTIDPEPEIIQQWHDVPDLAEGGVWRSPPFALFTQNGHWLLSIRSSIKRLTNNNDLTTNNYDLGPYKNSIWTDWVFHILFSLNNDGIIEIWENGIKLKTINGPNTYNDLNGNYLKMGLYKWVWLPEKDKGKSSTIEREIYYDDVRLGNEFATYKDVAP